MLSPLCQLYVFALSAWQLMRKIFQMKHWKCCISILELLFFHCLHFSSSTMHTWMCNICQWMAIGIKQMQSRFLIAAPLLCSMRFSQTTFFHAVIMSSVSLVVPFWELSECVNKKFFVFPFLSFLLYRDLRFYKYTRSRLFYKFAFLHF